MTAETHLAPPARASRRVPLRAMVFGLGSVFGKTLRDSRGAMLAVLALVGVMIVAGGEVMSTTYGSLATRAELGAMARDIPAMMRGLYGDPVNTDTLGGFISWHYGAYFALIGGLWSILALSATLAGEARRGSLEFAVATQRSRRGLAVEKVAGHVAAVALVMGGAGLVAWLTGMVFAIDPRDSIPAGTAAAFAIGLTTRALIAGSVAFALAPFVGRGASAGIAGALMVGGYAMYGYRTVVPLFDALSGVTWWPWQAAHIPLAGQVAWPGVAFTAIVCCVLLAGGVEAFARRDIGVTIALPTPAPPRVLIGVGGPIRRSFGDLLTGAFWWAVGLVIYGVVMTVVSSAMIDLLAGSPGLAEIFRTVVPGVDITTVAGFLQLAFVDLGFVLFGLAATTFVAGCWADESERRLELQLTTPLTRARWAASGGIAAMLAVFVVTVALGAAIAAGVTAIGEDPGPVAFGTLALGLYGVAVVGMGIAVGGIFGPRAAAPVVAAVVVGTFLLDTLAPILHLPDWVAQLALTTHMGEPMTGAWNAVGIVACLALAVGGLVAGAWGISRRDITG